MSALNTDVNMEVMGSGNTYRWDDVSKNDLRGESQAGGRLELKWNRHPSKPLALLWCVENQMCYDSKAKPEPTGICLTPTITCLESA